KQMILEEVRYAEELDPDFLKALISNDPEIKQMLDEFYKNTYLPALIEFFDQGRKEGYVNPDISNEALIAYMNIFKDGFRPDILNDREQNPRLAKEMITLFFYGLLEKRPES
ncbi:MAG TPA: hypothetical protein VFK27_00020, partial [Bacillales bacterium]|nr:hypothetical protein [Bacillales bacterium]